jgi:prepilin-type N-terminal cleavage/methylation domain-containing protein
MTKKDDGFTLIELVVVIAIIGVLVTLINVNFMQARARARDVQRKSEVRAIQKLLEEYKNDQAQQDYPNTSGTATAVLTATLVPGYISVVPIDPKEKASAGSWEDYSYARTGTLTYVLTACLENKVDPEADKTTACASGNGYIYRLLQP